MNDHRRTRSLWNLEDQETPLGHAKSRSRPENVAHTSNVLQTVPYDARMNSSTVSSVMIGYGALVALFGVIGAITSGSAISAITGVIFGALGILSGVAIRRGVGWGKLLGIAVTAFLTLFFFSRLVQGSVFPGVVVLILSALAFVVLVMPRRKLERSNG
jgi:uncharacterized membrane protein (UPF0136 family)